MRDFINQQKFSIALDGFVVGFFGLQSPNEILFNCLLICLIVTMVAMKSNQYLSFKKEKLNFEMEKEYLKNIESLVMEIVYPTLRDDQKTELINEYAVLKARITKGEDL